MRNDAEVELHPDAAETETLLARCFDAGLVNAVANCPDVRPFLGDRSLEPLDLMDAVLNEANVYLMGAWGGFAAMWSAPGVYEIHTMILPEGRGQWAKAAAREVCRTMWQEYDAEKLWTRIATDRPEVRLFTRWAGWKHVGLASFNVPGGTEIMDVFEMRSPRCLLQPH